MIKPLHKKIVIEEVVTENVSAAGIVLTGKRVDVKHSKVLAIGNEVTEVKVGDTLIVDWQFATKSSYNNTAFFVIDEDHVIAVVEE
jgi:co-chaperonin GroES (HSP10)